MAVMTMNIFLFDDSAYVEQCIDQRRSARAINSEETGYGRSGTCERHSQMHQSLLIVCGVYRSRRARCNRIRARRECDGHERLGEGPSLYVNVILQYFICTCAYDSSILHADYKKFGFGTSSTNLLSNYVSCLLRSVRCWHRDSRGGGAHYTERRDASIPATEKHFHKIYIYRT